VRVVLVTTAVVALLVVYGSWTARRLDRLHARVDTAGAGLDAQLHVRADAAAALALTRGLPPAVAAALARAAERAAASEGLGHEREVVESALSRALQDAAAALRLRARDAVPDAAPAVDAAARASFARRFHNDAVRDALTVRRRWVVRLLHLAGRAPRPTYFEMDDAPLVISGVAAAAAPYD
jgi:hypothetical protein